MRLFLVKLTLALGIYLILFLVVELGARIVTGNWVESFLERDMNSMKTADPAAHDPILGWIPKAGYSTNSNYWRRQLSITSEGLRSNGAASVPLTGRPILAIGDSFTFGDEVADHETWPAHLERLLQKPVLNGGVFGYGIDQMVLRARQLVAQTQPEWVVLSFIPDDIRRCELRVRGAEKPYFRLVDGTLRLENQPVPLPDRLARDWFRRVGGHSWVVHKVMCRADLEYWFAGRNQVVAADENGHAVAERRVTAPLLAVVPRDENESNVAHRNGDAVAAALLCQLADELAAKKVKLLIVAQTDVRLFKHARAETLLAALHRHQVPVLNLLKPLADMKEQEPSRFESYFHDHMTDFGNRYVAEQIAAKIRR